MSNYNPHDDYEDTGLGVLHGCVAPIAGMAALGSLIGLISEIIDGREKLSIFVFACFFIILSVIFGSYVIRLKSDVFRVACVKFTGKVSFNPFPCMLFTGIAYGLLVYFLKKTEIETFDYILGIVMAALFGGGAISYFAYVICDDYLPLWKLWLISLIAVLLGLPLICGILWLFMVILGLILL